MIELLIVDDHAIMRSGLSQIFALMPEVRVAGEARNGLEALQWLSRTPVDLLLLDVNMPGLSGAALIHRVRQQHPGLPILILSMYDQPHIAAEMLAADANGFISKDCEPDILLAAIRRVAAGGNYIDPVMAEKMAFSGNNTLRDLGRRDGGIALRPRPRHSLLSRRECEVLQGLIQGHAIKQIGERLSISGKTVSTHKLRLMDKLAVENMADLMRYAIEHGLDALLSDRQLNQ
jgi:DNA-binding NarL/FixJ family response regulator